MVEQDHHLYLILMFLRGIAVGVSVAGLDYAFSEDLLLLIFISSFTGTMVLFDAFRDFRKMLKYRQ